MTFDIVVGTIEASCIQDTIRIVDWPIQQNLILWQQDIVERHILHAKQRERPSFSSENPRSSGG